MTKTWSFLTKLLVAAMLCGGVMVPAAAYAWGHGGWGGGGWGGGWHGGWGGGWGCCRGGVYFGFAPPVYIGPPVVYAGPPVVYAPPPYYAAPPAPGPSPIGQSCYAGAYICPLDNPGPVGSPCTCPANNGRVQGAIR